MGHICRAAAVGLLLAGGLAGADPSSAQTTSGSALGPVHLEASNSPGLGPAAWQLLSFDQAAAFYFTKSRIAREGSAGVGWFTEVFSRPRDYPDIGVSGVQFQQSLIWADCTHNAYGVREFAWYDAEGKLIPQSAYLVSNPAFMRPESNSTAASEVSALCGTLAGKGPLNGDGRFLLADYRQRLNHPAGAGAILHTGSTTADTGAANRSSTATKAPGLGKATWHPVTFTDDFVEFYTLAGIKRAGNSAEGWFTDVYSKPQDLGSAAGVIFIQTLVEADCGNSTSKLLQTASYGKDQKMMTQGPVANQSFERAGPGSIAADEVDVLCGRAKQSAAIKPEVGDGEGLWEFTKILLEMQKKNAAKQD